MKTLRNHLFERLLNLKNRTLRHEKPMEHIYLSAAENYELLLLEALDPYYDDAEDLGNIQTALANIQGIIAQYIDTKG